MSTIAPPVGRPRGPRVKGGQPSTSSYAQLLAQVQAAGLLGRRYRYYATKVGLALAALAGVWVAFAFLGDS